MAKSSNRGPWIIAGAIVLAALLIVITLLLLDDDGEEASSPSATASEQPSPRHSRSPRPSRPPGPSASPTATPSPSASPSPEVDPTEQVRQVVARQAERDRPGQVKHVGKVEFYADRAGCPQSGQASSTLVRFTEQPKFGIYIFCKAKVHWKYADGPIYGE